METKALPAHPSLEQYKKQAKELLKSANSGNRDALQQILQLIKKDHPRFGRLADLESQGAKLVLADAQLVIAREHGFESWPRFAKHIETLRLTREVASLADPAAAFIEASCVPLHMHNSGTLDGAEMILARYPHIATSSIHTA